ncbi:MAG: sensor histidine kinase [Halolamina sp.]
MSVGIAVGRHVDGRYLVGWFAAVLFVAAAVTHAESTLPYLLDSAATTTVLSAAVLESLALAVPPVALFIGAYRLTGAALDERGYHIVARWTAAGALLALSLATTELLHHLARNGLRASSVALHVTTTLGFGGVFGYVVGRRTAAASRNAERARERRAEFEFLNNLLRHHVLNRMNVLGGYADLLLETAEGRERRFLETISSHADSVANVVSDVRAVTKAVSGRERLRPTDLVGVVRAEAVKLDDTYDAAVEWSLPESAPVASNGGLSVAVGHLLENAIEHNDAPEPTVRVAVEPDHDGEVVVSVRDNGSGIPAEVRETAGDPGETGDQPFGLYLVHTVVADCGGSLDIADTADGGTEVRVRLPTPAASSRATET